MEDRSALIHYGIKGMKWGVRRTPEQLGHKPANPRAKRISVTINGGGKKTSDSAKTESKPAEKPKVEGKTEVRRSKRASEMSDNELRAAINRIEMERKYAQLTAPQKSKGRKIVGEILGTAAKQTAQKYTTQAMNKLVENLLKKMTSNSSGSSGGSGGGP